MPDQKIIDLPPLVSQNPSDLKETSANGTGSFRETRAQELTYINANAQLPSSAKVTGLDTQLSAKVNKAGDTMTGALILNADPVTALGAATKQYVDSAAANVDLQQAYDNSSSPQHINFATGEGLIFKDHLGANCYLFTETYASFFKPLTISETGDEGLSVLGSSDPASTMLEVLSTDKGAKPVPAWSQTVRDTIPTGGIVDYLSGYNVTTKTWDYYDLTSWQKLLNTQNVSGSGTVTVTDNGDGTIDIFGSGGSPTPAPSFGAYSVINNSAPRPATAGSFGAVPVSSGFTDVSDSNFTSQTMTIGGVNTVGSTYTGTETNNFVVTQSCVLRPTSAFFREYYYAIAILRADTSIVTTSYQAYANTAAVLNAVPASMSGVVQLSQGDTVFTQIMSPSSDANSPTYTITSEVSSIAGSTPDAVLTTGSYADPAWITSLAASKLTGTVLFANGGFGFTTATTGDIFYASASNTPAKLGVGLSGQVIQSNGTTPAYTSTLSSLVLGNIPKVTIQAFSSGSATYVTPANCTHIRVQIWGAGGGGGGIEGITSAAGGTGGGGGGGHTETIIINPAATYAYSVGAGGAGGTGGDFPGSAGGNTTFGSMTANGGAGGSGNTSTTIGDISLGGLGGTASGGLLNIAGSAGSYGINLNATVTISGSGGSSSSGGGASRGVIDAAGLTGLFPGGGGSGASSIVATDRTGGTGAAGAIIVEEYYAG